MEKRIRRFGMCGAAVLWLLAGQPVWGQQARVEARAGGTEFSLSAFPLYQFDTGLEGGAEYNVKRYFFRFDAGREMHSDLEAGMGLSYDYEDWDFTGATGFRGIPWGEIHRTGIDLRFRFTGIENWSLMFLPGLESSRESGADWGGSIQTGAALAASRRVAPKLTLGLGAGIYTGLEETRAYPFLVVRWQITDRVLLANPFRPGPTGPAGLELIYTVDDHWTAAAGSAWRSFRFRLDDRGPAPEGIGEVDSVPTWGRLTWRPDRRWVFDLYAGYALDGELTLESRNGDEIGSVDQDAAPFGALSVGYRF